MNIIRYAYLGLPSSVRAVLENIWNRPITPISLVGLALYMLVPLFLGEDTAPEVDRTLTAGAAGEHLIGQTITGTPYVVDGDTIIMNGISFRLHGIDAFEINQTCKMRDRREVMCGEWAKNALESNIADDIVSCHVNGIDPWDRAIAVCGTQAHPDLNAAMVYNGMALAYTRFSDDYVHLQKAAELAQAGAWEGYFMQPWNVRVGAVEY